MSLSWETRHTDTHKHKYMRLRDNFGKVEESEKIKYSSQKQVTNDKN